MQQRPKTLIGFNGYVDKLVRPRKSQEFNSTFASVAEFGSRLMQMGGTSSDTAVTRLYEKIGGKVVAVAEEGVQFKEIPGQLVIRQRYVSQELAPLVNIVPVQAFIDYIALAKGHDSGSFRCGSKVTVKL